MNKIKDIIINILNIKAIKRISDIYFNRTKNSSGGFATSTITAWEIGA